MKTEKKALWLLAIVLVSAVHGTPVKRVGKRFLTFQFNLQYYDSSIYLKFLHEKCENFAYGFL